MNRSSIDALKAAAVWIPAALVVGVVIGGYGPRQELRQTRAELEWMEAERSPHPDRRLNQMTDIVGLTLEPRRAESPPLPHHAESESTDEPAALVPGDESDRDDAPEEGEDETQSLADRLAVARDLWQVRSDMARDTFISRAGLDRSEQVRFGVLVEAMNIRIEESFATAVDRIRQQGEVSPETMTRMLHDVTGALTLTYDEMDRNLSPDWRVAAGSDVDLVDFIDPAVARPLLEVENLLEEAPRRGRGRRPW